MKIFLFVRALILVCSVALCSDVLAAVIDEMEGVYIVPGQATAQNGQEEPFTAVEGATDCLVIRKK